MKISVYGLLNTATHVSPYSVGEIIGQGRYRPLVRVRHAVMWLAREHTDLSIASIARLIGRRDHTTALHALSLTGKAAFERDQIAARIMNAYAECHTHQKGCFPVEITFKPGSRRVVAALPDGAIAAVMRGATRAEVAAMYPEIKQMRS